MIIWLASYPKSGNTWLRFFIISLLMGKKTNLNLNHLKAIMAYPEKSQFKGLLSDVLDLGLRLSALSDGYYDLTIGACLVENELLPKTFEGDRSQSTWRDLVLEGRKLTFNHLTRKSSFTYVF